MARILTCKKCGETEMDYAKTGACIDGRYYCQTCYNEKMDAAELNEIRKPKKGGV